MSGCGVVLAWRDRPDPVAGWRFAPGPGRAGPELIGIALVPQRRRGEAEQALLQIITACDGTHTKTVGSGEESYYYTRSSLPLKYVCRSVPHGLPDTAAGKCDLANAQLAAPRFCRE